MNPADMDDAYAIADPEREWRRIVRINDAALDYYGDDGRWVLRIPGPLSGMWREAWGREGMTLGEAIAWAVAYMEGDSPVSDMTETWDGWWTVAVDMDDESRIVVSHDGTRAAIILPSGTVIGKPGRCHFGHGGAIGWASDIRIEMKRYRRETRHDDTEGIDDER